MLFSKLIEKIYRKNMFARRDPDGTVFYFSAEDFVGLNKHPFSFKNVAGDTLNGNFYSYENPIQNKLVVFDHGMGTGHRAYLREIEMLCRHGYRVFSYDHTGCGSSEGETMQGFSGSVADLDFAIKAIKEHNESKKCDIYVMGHSWGGFSTMNIPSLHPDIKKIVAMSGFESVGQIQRQFISGILSPFRRGLFELEERTNGKYASLSSVESLKNMKGEALIIHSYDDKTVNVKRHFEKIRTALSDKKNVRFLLVNGKDHNPNYTADAVKYKNKFFLERKTLTKKNRLKTDEEKNALIMKYDWYRMTEQDEELWQIIFDFLDN